MLVWWYLFHWDTFDWTIGAFWGPSALHFHQHAAMGFRDALVCWAVLGWAGEGVFYQFYLASIITTDQKEYVLGTIFMNVIPVIEFFLNWLHSLRITDRFYGIIITIFKRKWTPMKMNASRSTLTAETAKTNRKTKSKTTASPPLPTHVPITICSQLGVCPQPRAHRPATTIVRYPANSHQLWKIYLIPGYPTYHADLITKDIIDKLNSLSRAAADKQG